MFNKQPIQKSALIIVDAQESFRARGEKVWTSGRPTTFLSSLQSILSAYRETKLPVYFVIHSDDDIEFTLDSPHYKVLDELKHQSSEPLIHKTVHNSFTGTNLQHDLLKQGVTRLIVTGIRTEQCCETTTRVASDLGFDVDFITEATLTFPIKNETTGKTLSAEDIIERTEFVLENRFARITTVEEILNEIKESYNE